MTAKPWQTMRCDPRPGRFRRGAHRTLVAALGALVLVAQLAACGGGGGGDVATAAGGAADTAASASPDTVKPTGSGNAAPTISGSVSGLFAAPSGSASAGDTGGDTGGNSAQSPTTQPGQVPTGATTVPATPDSGEPPPAAAPASPAPSPAPSASTSGSTGSSGPVSLPQSRAFEGGFFIYPAVIRGQAVRAGQDPTAALEAWMQRLTTAGFNLFHVAVANDMAYWLDLAQRLNFRFVAQLDTAYMTSTDPAVINARLADAVRIVSGHVGNERLVAITVKEEPTLAQMPALDTYYQGLVQQLPGVKLHLLHNNRAAAAYSLSVKPQVMGTDRYAFWGWDASAGGYSATPASALNWLHEDLKAYEQYARANGAEFASVLTANRGVTIVTDQALRGGSYGDYARIMRLVDQGNMGWARLADGRLRFYKYYGPPTNTISAMTWLSVLGNAKSVMFWSGDSVDPTLDAIYAKGTFVPDAQSSAYELSLLQKSSEIWLTSTGTLQNNYPSFAEIATSLADVRRYGGVIRAMQPAGTGGWLSPTDSMLRQREFAIAGIAGRFVLTVNLDVGTWPSNSVPSLWYREDHFPITAQGELAGYIPKTTSRQTVITASSGERVYDVAGWSAVDNGGAAALQVAPGGARLVFVGTPGEAARAQSQYGG